MINVMVIDLIDTSRSNIENTKLSTIDDVRQQTKPLMAFSQEMTEIKLELKQFLRSNLYRHYRVHRMSMKASAIISALFEAFMNDPRILPTDVFEQCIKLEKDQSEDDMARGIADYIAGMTDRYAIVEYERIFNPRQLSFVNLIP